MTNLYDPDPLTLEEPPYNPPDNHHPPTVGPGLGFWLFACSVATIAAVVIACLLLATPARAAVTERDGVEVAHAPPMALATVSGTSTWYCGSGSPCTRGYPASGMFAAAGSELRAWRGELVRVRANGRSVVVRLIDVCACPGARVIDLYRTAFARLASPSRGVIRVTVERERSLPLPPTDTP